MEFWNLKWVLRYRRKMVENVKQKWYSLVTTSWIKCQISNEYKGLKIYSIWILFVNGGLNPIFFKLIECCNFQIITEMYIKVYISEMKMSQRIHFWYQITKNDDFFEKMAKKHFFGQQFLWQANKNSFELKMPKFLGNHVKTHVQERIFCFLT